MFMPLQWFNAWKSVSLSLTHTEFTLNLLISFFFLSVTSNLASPVDRPRFGERPALRLYLLMRTIFATRHPGPTLFPSGLFVYSFCSRVCVYVCMCAPVYVSVGCVVCLHRCVCVCVYLSSKVSLSLLAYLCIFLSIHFVFSLGWFFFPSLRDRPLSNPSILPPILFVGSQNPSKILTGKTLTYAKT